MKNVITQTISATHALAQDFVDSLEHGKQRIVGLTGDLGSGKTTFTQGILAACGAQGPYTSPTFTIMKEYDVDMYGIKKVYHIDAYRIASNDMIELGWKDLISDPAALVIIEWPENIKDILPNDMILIRCRWVGDEEREYIFP